MLIYGKRTARIKRCTDHQHPCNSCKGFDLDVKIYREYFHVFFIPVSPSGEKEVFIRCNQCGEPMRDHKLKKYYEDTSRTPFYFYSALLLVILGGVALFVGNNFAQKEKDRLVNNPVSGDVYLLRKNAYGSVRYSFLLIAAVTESQVTAYHSQLEYGQWVNSMSERDFFVKEDKLRFNKKELKQLLNDGEINAVYRNYDDSKGFNKIR